MKLQDEVLQCFVHLKKNVPRYGKAYRELLNDLFRKNLSRLLNETNTNEKMMYSGRVQQLDELIKQFDEAEDILLKRSRQ